MPQIHPTAIVEAGAELADDVTIGPYCCVGPEVALAAGVVLQSHVVVTGRTRVGARTYAFPFTSLGQVPQDKKYKGEPARLEIGEDNVIREGVTMNIGTEGGGMLTKVGDRCLFMTGAHVAHDCRVGNDVILVNNATLAGHVVIDDFAMMSGLSAVHQFCRIGRYAIVGGVTGVERDVIPYGMVMGDRARLTGLNLRGLQRNGFSTDEIRTLRQAYAELFGSEGTLIDRVAAVAGRYTDAPAVMEIIDFIRSDSSRRLVLPDTDHGA
ncbi:MAG TPA: acyl-ACP--UDP-N-acetylglucosamine O-acyltransferase [Aliidongia sp.]|uniref:acyl-ACP--UDP-N-acetylglucosamine O-acyltransferase n=1 Tax=Aliidongia sp. TaxID=1914230 RepID=UPI002DDD2E59|nr:acyl-ACP--UDP-N-acetylglucosamine O-acyltransferase [Aliidongia sp.]HEV2678502.1 acyl-ACP--UDP-N-acetylglucosamine O-acyltransferase [Aliidongia sp.]